MSRPEIAVVGAGYIGRAHIDALRSSATCALSAIADPSAESAALAARCGVPHLRSLDELLARARPDGVVLATPNTLHVPQALQCLAAGLPVLLEKPVAPSVREALALVEAAEQAKARLLIGHHRAHSPIMAKAKQAIDSGMLGRLVAITGSAMFFKPDEYFRSGPWRREPGGGPILINLIHEIHNLRILCGEIAAVQALASSAIRGFPVEDTVAINLRFASGALGTFMLTDTAACARSWEQTSGENEAYPRYADEDCYVVAGTDGSLAVPSMRFKRYGRREDRSWWKPFEVGTLGVDAEDPIRRQMEHFSAVVRGEVAPLVTARDGMANLRVIEAISEAARSGRPVELAA
jgi:predicted dehydrogenase